MTLRGAIAGPISMDALVRMRIFAAIDPGPPPAGVVDEYGVAAPVKSVIAPAPWPEKSSERHAISETDRATDIDAGPRGVKDNARVVVGHHDEGGIRGHDRYVWPAADNNLAIAAKITVVTSPPPLSLDSFHHLLLLFEERISEFGGAVHGRGHHLQLRGTRQA